MKLLMPLPDTNFDTTEVAVPWRLLTDLGRCIELATPVSWRTLDPAGYDGLILPGGHGPGMSARWPGDAYLFSRRFHQVLTGAG